MRRGCLFLVEFAQFDCASIRNLLLDYKTPILRRFFHRYPTLCAKTRSMTRLQIPLFLHRFVKPLIKKLRTIVFARLLQAYKWQLCWGHFNVHDSVVGCQKCMQTFHFWLRYSTSAVNSKISSILKRMSGFSGIIRHRVA